MNDVTARQPAPPLAPWSGAVERAGIFVLSAVAGYVDTAGYLTLYGLFTAHVTGNFVTAGAALAQHAPDGVVARLAMLPIFMAAVAATTLGARAVRRKGRSPLAPLLAAMTVALALFWAAGVLLRPQASSPDAWAVITIGGTGIAAMGVQNALMREALGTSAPTTVMTGNLTQVTIDLV
ncbi:MAG: permease, partial [Labilithrix sp.]|nr:permease [Labilithrix sp.]